MYSINKIYNLDCLEGLKLLPDECVNTCVTSPPYWGLRDYGVAGQLGLEKTPEEFISKLVVIFREIKRVLKKDGTLWVNIGDSYMASKTGSQGNGKSTLLGGKETQIQAGKRISKKHESIKQKDLVGIPWMLAFALRADGWYLRQDIIWHKPNPMPESVTDRCTKSHEYIFLLSKSKTYYFDHKSIMVQAINLEDDARRLRQSSSNHKSAPTELKNGLRPKSWNGSSFDTGKTGLMKETNGFLRKSGNKQRKSGAERGCPAGNSSNVNGSVPWEGNLANKRSVWSVTTKPFKESHFATFPPELIIDCIKAGSPIDGLVLDPFMGAGTTALVSQKLNRNYVGFELNPDYIKIAEKRLKSDLGMFLKTEEIITNQLAIV